MTASSIGLLGTASLAMLLTAADSGPALGDDNATPASGRALAFDPGKGNCLACHDMEGGESPGDLGPPLIAIAARFPDKGRLRQQLWDPMALNPGSRMPPFGRHRILTEDEIDRVVEYVYSL